jgi:hypothetical protein
MNSFQKLSPKDIKENGEHPQDDQLPSAMKICETANKNT